MSSSVIHRKRILQEWCPTMEYTPSQFKGGVIEKSNEETVCVVSPVVCPPCRAYTKGTEKPSWAIHGCPGKGHKNKTILQPQFPAEERPKRSWPVRLNGIGFSCVHPECLDYKKVYKNKSGAQQHAKKHYPAEYKCSDCGGEWYLKTEYNQHFLKPCRHCGKNFMKGSLPGHETNCEKKK